ncbi:MAG: hypothetical protein ABIU84_08875 [Thermoanaerobaculia bacterium]
MSGLDPRQFLEHVVRPALAALPPEYHTTAAEQLVLGTAAVESKLRWLKQVGGGPAMGLFQMEPVTFRDIRDRFLRERPKLGSAFRHSAVALRPEADELCWNLRLAALCCRLRYIMSPHQLPPAHDVPALAREWKSTYNTHLGAGQPADFEQAWAAIIAPAKIDWAQP